MNNQTISRAKSSELKGYTVGYLLSLALTLVPFLLVMKGVLAGTAGIVVISAFALAQIFVHLTLFLHLHKSSDEPYKLPLFFYTLIILAIIVGASIWILHHLDMYHMMH